MTTRHKIILGVVLLAVAAVVFFLWRRRASAVATAGASPAAGANQNTGSFILDFQKRVSSIVGTRDNTPVTTPVGGTVPVGTPGVVGNILRRASATVAAHPLFHN